MEQNKTRELMEKMSNKKVTPAKDEPIVEVKMDPNYPTLPMGKTDLNTVIDNAVTKGLLDILNNIIDKADLKITAEDKLFSMAGKQLKSELKATIYVLTKD